MESPAPARFSSASFSAAWPDATRERGGAAVQRGDALLEHVVRGVHDPRVDVAELAQAEQVRGVLGVPEVVGDRLVDRDGARTGRGIGGCAGVDGAGVETRGWSSRSWYLPLSGS